MGDAYKCDVCSDLYEGEPLKIHIQKGTKTDDHSGRKKRQYHEYDVCHQCLASTKEYVENE